MQIRDVSIQRTLAALLTSNTRSTRSKPSSVNYVLIINMRQKCIMSITVYELLADCAAAAAVATAAAAVENKPRSHERST